MGKYTQRWVVRGLQAAFWFVSPFQWGAARSRGRMCLARVPPKVEAEGKALLSHGRLLCCWQISGGSQERNGRSAKLLREILSLRTKLISVNV